jgi:two-component system cell cycle response regulator DivK
MPPTQPILPRAVMPRLLLVEDNEMNRDMLSRRPIKRGYEVLIAEGGGAGVAREGGSSRSDPMDTSFPVIDGCEATRQLKTDPAVQRIPIIALTAHAMAGDEAKAKAREAGCDDFDTKSVDFARLIGKIETFLPPA